MKLGVNIDHVATIRQARRTVYPNPLDAARLCQQAGAHSLTVHLREDRRHIQDRDVYELKRTKILPLNLEMSIAPEIVKIAQDVQPEEVCLVPERRQELTTEGGLDVVGHKNAVRDVVDTLKKSGIVVSLFIEPDARQIQAAADLQVPYVELHTGTFCEAIGEKAQHELQRLIDGARLAHKLGLKVNAGHGINLDNMNSVLEIPHLDTLNIGHSIVSRAVLIGMKEAVSEMLTAMKKYRGGHA